MKILFTKKYFKFLKEDVSIFLLTRVLPAFLLGIFIGDIQRHEPINITKNLIYGLLCVLYFLVLISIVYWVREDKRLIILFKPWVIRFSDYLHRILKKKTHDKNK